MVHLPPTGERTWAESQAQPVFRPPPYPIVPDHLADADERVADGWTVRTLLALLSASLAAYTTLRVVHSLALPVRAALVGTVGAAGWTVWTARIEGAGISVWIARIVRFVLAPHDRVAPTLLRRRAHSVDP